MPRRDLSDAVVLITGGGAGVGAATVGVLAERGARVVAVDIDERAAQAAVSPLGERGLAVAANVADREAVRAAVAAALERFDRLDVVIANAGIASRPATMRMLNDEEIDRVLDVNLRGAFNTVRASLDPVVEARGHFVLVSSTGALFPSIGGVPYGASKAAVEALGRGLRVELAPHGVTVTVTYFGIVDTAMAAMTVDRNATTRKAEELLPGPLRKRLTPEQAARGVVGAIEAQQARLIIPKAWRVFDLARAFAGRTDGFVARNKDTQAFIRALEADR